MKYKLRNAIEESNSERTVFLLSYYNSYLSEDPLPLKKIHFFLEVRYNTENKCKSSQMNFPGLFDGKLKFRWLNYAEFYVCWTCFICQDVGVGESP